MFVVEIVFVYVFTIGMKYNRERSIFSFFGVSILNLNYHIKIFYLYISVIPMKLSSFYYYLLSSSIEIRISDL